MKQFRGIVESPHAPSTDMIWVYNKELKYFTNGKWEPVNTKSLTEEDSSSVKAVNTDTLEYITLEEGSTKAIKTSNYDKLVNRNTNFIKINNGFGIVTWDNSKGGQAHIITAYGNTLYYSISNKGAINKDFESPDIYLEYVNSGGKKTYKEFINELVDLIG